MGLLNRKLLYRFIVDNDFPLLRLLYFNRWFRLAFFLSVLLFFGIPIGLMKIWLSTPNDFLPEIRISLLDKLQSYSLHYSAKRAWKKGEGEEAIDAWRGAIANDPGRIDLCREFMNLLNDLDIRRLYRFQAAQNALWLLRLNQTNAVDVELIAETFEHYEFEQLTIQILSDYSDPMNPALERAQMRAFFLQGRIQEFGKLWQKVDAKIKDHPDMHLFGTTYLAGWGTPKEAVESMEQLELAMKEESSSALAHRLNLFVSFTRLDPDAYLDSLTFLEKQNLDRPPHHLGYWNLLSALDRESEAKQLARNYANPPRSAVEATLFAEAYIRLGLRDLAFRFLQRYSIDYGNFEGMWHTQAEILISEERWGDLYFLALSMREESPSEALTAYSFFLQGRADLERKRIAAARESFREIRRFSFRKSQTGLYVASNLFHWGFPVEARDVLKDIQKGYRDNLVYWELFFRVSNAIGSARDLLLCTENIYRIMPNDQTARNNFAAALLSLRIRPDEAITLTLQGLSQRPNNLAAKINHAHALLLNERVEEAAGLLESINEKLLIAPLQQAYFLARTEIEFLRSKFGLAKTFADQIDERDLMPGDRVRLREIKDILLTSPLVRRETLLKQTGQKGGQGGEESDEQGGDQK